MAAPRPDIVAPSFSENDDMVDDQFAGMDEDFNDDDQFEDFSMDKDYGMSDSFEKQPGATNSTTVPVSGISENNQVASEIPKPSKSNVSGWSTIKFNTEDFQQVSGINEEEKPKPPSKDNIFQGSLGDEFSEENFDYQSYEDHRYDDNVAMNESENPEKDYVNNKNTASPYKSEQQYPVNINANLDSNNTQYTSQSVNSNTYTESSFNGNDIKRISDKTDPFERLRNENAKDDEYFDKEADTVKPEFMEGYFNEDVNVKPEQSLEGLIDNDDEQGGADNIEADEGEVAETGEAEGEEDEDYEDDNDSDGEYSEDVSDDEDINEALNSLGDLDAGKHASVDV